MDVFLLALIIAPTIPQWSLWPFSLQRGLKAENIASRVDGILKEPLEDWGVSPNLIIACWSCHIVFICFYYYYFFFFVKLFFLLLLIYPLLPFILWDPGGCWSHCAVSTGALLGYLVRLVRFGIDILNVFTWNWRRWVLWHHRIAPS